MADGGDFGGGSGEPALLEPFELVWLDVALVYRDAFFLEHRDHRLPCDAIEEGIGGGGVHFAIFDKEDVGTRRLGHIAAVIHHHRV